jgi:hypothetical protein
MDMEELHRIHKDVPFGYWVEWVVPAYRWLERKWAERRTHRPLPTGLKPTAR